MSQSKKKTIQETENNEQKRIQGTMPLGFTMCVVNSGLASSIVALLNENECATSFIVRGMGTYTNDFYGVLGVGDEKKDVICSFVRLSNWENLKADLQARFKTSRLSSGIAWVAPLTMLAGLSTYKYLTNARNGIDVKEEVVMEQTLEYEAIFAIVNDGYTDLVVSASRKAGARGGTIINGRGTGNKEIEKFYGVVITPEKKIVMILVPKDIRNDVLAAINNAVGFGSKGQGIAFSLPLADVVGIVPPKKEEAAE